MLVFDLQEVFWCYHHDHWTPEYLTDRDGRLLPFFRWQPFDWR